MPHLSKDWRLRDGLLADARCPEHTKLSAGCSAGDRCQRYAFVRSCDRDAACLWKLRIRFCVTNPSHQLEDVIWTLPALEGIVSPSQVSDVSQHTCYCAALTSWHTRHRLAQSHAIPCRGSNVYMTIPRLACGAGANTMQMCGTGSRPQCVATLQAQLGFRRLPLARPTCMPVLQQRPLRLHCRRAGHLVTLASRQTAPETEQRAPQQASGGGRRLLRFGGGRGRAGAPPREQAENNIAPLPRGRR